jgi:hypothetical protein
VSRGAFEPTTCGRCNEVIAQFEHVYGDLERGGGLFCSGRCKELHHAAIVADARARLAVLRAALETVGALGFVWKRDRGGWWVCMDGSTTPSPFPTKAEALAHATRRAELTIERLAKLAEAKDGETP